MNNVEALDFAAAKLTDLRCGLVYRVSTMREYNIYEILVLSLESEIASYDAALEIIKTLRERFKEELKC